MIIVNDQQKWTSLKEFIDDAKAHPNQIIYSSSGLYGALHIPMALFAKAAGDLKLRHLPTAGGGPALTALLGNNSQASGLVGLRLPVADQSRQRRAHWPRSAASARRRCPRCRPSKSSALTSSITCGSACLPPRARLTQLISKLRTVLSKAAHTDSFKAALVNLGQDLAYLDQPEFAKFWDADAQRIQDAVRQIGKVEG